MSKLYTKHLYLWKEYFEINGLRNQRNSSHCETVSLRKILHVWGFYAHARIIMIRQYYFRDNPSNAFPLHSLCTKKNRNSKMGVLGTVRQVVFVVDTSSALSGIFNMLLTDYVVPCIE